MLREPSLKNLTDQKFGKPAEIQNSLLQQLGAPHTSSFNYFTGEGLDAAVSSMEPLEFSLPNDAGVVKLSISDAILKPPVVPPGTIGVRKHTIYPSECRQRAATYKGMLSIRIRWHLNGKEQIPFDQELGEIPIMVKSSLCHLSLMTPSQLVASGEHEDEWGGYFIVKGHEKLIRMLQLTRRNYPLTIRRSGWKGRGNLFSDCGVSIRCVTKDQTSTTNVLHFVKDGTAKLMFSHRKNLYYVPMVLILKSMCDHVDVYIYKKLIEGYEEDQYYSDCVQNMLRDLHMENLHTREECLMYLGKLFRPKFYECPERMSDEEVGEYILKKCLLIHLDSNEDKFNLLTFMCKKLFVFVQDRCKVEGADSVMMQELLLGGHLYLQYMKERMQTWLLGVRRNILKMAAKNVSMATSQASVQRSAKFAGGISHAMESFLATGNISTQTGLGLMQEKGLTIVTENINRMRYMSHFRAIHRGAFFVEMRTTEARQLLPDHWGFVCPVHTPDGAPCGLLNHLTMDCVVTNVPEIGKVENILGILSRLGLILINKVDCDVKDYYCVQLDGRVLGYMPQDAAKSAVDRLRLLKIAGEEVPNMLEIVLVPIKKFPGQFPGIFLFTGPARMMRPVIHLGTGNIEYIGTFEQVYMDICCRIDERYDVTTHMEISDTTILSNLAQLIPMPDCNQSPRNMYQCQMGKQTMGTPVQNWNLLAETKMYRLQTPHSPLFRPVHYDRVNLDHFPMGTNAIVAVISYTGYDMEDAIVINKMSEERGLAHGSIYKSEFIELDEVTSFFCRDPYNTKLTEFLDTDGLPYPGRKMVMGDPLYCFYNPDESKYILVKYPSREQAFINSVRQCGNLGNKVKRMVCISYRISRNPSVGDKFASRAGQKGILSRKWSAEDLPFTETGLIPDIIFNPHGFPSRMTIAMMIEVMAGKSASLHGLIHDATPWKFNEKNTAVDYFGKMLEAGGYNYYGNETMYSGIDGREMEVQIFFGVVHYQRLRHMVADKWQVRSTGPMDVVTRQPLKGRKRGGGVRFGEMERDALISHGTSFLLQDRLLNCSDKTTVFICTKCNSILGPITVVTRLSDKACHTESKEVCQLCGKGDDVSTLQVPYIFKFFCTQLASCNVNIKVHTKPT